MNTAVVVSSPPNAVAHALTAPEMKAQIQRIQQVMKAVMKDKVHFGKVPGTPKPSLWKPGAEVLCATFHIAPSYRVDDLSDADAIRYRVTCVGTHQATGVVLGEGMGEASSNEEKYRWRAVVCDEEFESTDEDRRRVKYKRGDNGIYTVAQVRTEPADIANTVLKMACKRAQVAMTLNVTAASDIFTQDLEDMPEELRGRNDAAGDNEGGGDGRQQQPAQRGRPETQAPRSRSNGNGASSTGGGNGRCTDRQANLINVKLDQAGIAPNEFLKLFEINAVGELPFAKVNEALAWIANPGDGGGEG